MIAPSVMNLTAVPVFSRDYDARELALAGILVTPRRADRFGGWRNKFR